MGDLVDPTSVLPANTRPLSIWLNALFLAQVALGGEYRGIDRD